MSESHFSKQSDGNNGGSESTFGSDGNNYPSLNWFGLAVAISAASLNPLWRILLCSLVD